MANQQQMIDSVRDLYDPASNALLSGSQEVKNAWLGNFFVGDGHGSHAKGLFELYQASRPFLETVINYILPPYARGYALIVIDSIPANNNPANVGVYNDGSHYFKLYIGNADVARQLFDDIAPYVVGKFDQVYGINYDPTEHNFTDRWADLNDNNSDLVQPIVGSLFDAEGCQSFQHKVMANGYRTSPRLAFSQNSDPQMCEGVFGSSSTYDVGLGWSYSKGAAATHGLTKIASFMDKYAEFCIRKGFKVVATGYAFFGYDGSSVRSTAAWPGLNMQHPMPAEVKMAASFPSSGGRGVNAQQANPCAILASRYSGYLGHGLVQCGSDAKPLRDALGNTIPIPLASPFPAFAAMPGLLAVKPVFAQ